MSDPQLYLDLLRAILGFEKNYAASVVSVSRTYHGQFVTGFQVVLLSDVLRQNDLAFRVEGNDGVQITAAIVILLLNLHFFLRQVITVNMMTLRIFILFGIF